MIARLTVYEEKTQPILEHYAKQNKLFNIVSPNSDVGYAQIQALLHQLNQNCKNPPSPLCLSGQEPTVTAWQGVYG